MIVGNTDEGSTSTDGPMMCRGVRGAITVKENSVEAILEATREMLAVIVRVNDINKDDIASAYFTTTEDLNATFPAIAARQLGWRDVPLMCGHEMKVPNSLPMCVRVLIHWNTRRSAQEIGHVYLKEAKSLRPDLEENRTPVRPKQVSEMETLVKVMGATL